MTSDIQAARTRLEEILAEVRTLDEGLIEPLTLNPSIRNLEETIEAYEKFTEDDSVTCGDDQ